MKMQTAQVCLSHSLSQRSSVRFNHYQQSLPCSARALSLRSVNSCDVQHDFRNTPSQSLTVMYSFEHFVICRPKETSLQSCAHVYKLLIPKTIGNRKRDCAWGCARGINTTWENLHIEKHKSVRWAERTPSWFVLFDLQIFSRGVYPRAQPRARSLFLFPIVFGINLIHFSMRRRTVQPEIRSFVSVLRSPVTPFDRSKTKNANCFEECNVFGNGKCELSAIQEGRN